MENRNTRIKVLDQQIYKFNDAFFSYFKAIFQKKERLKFSKTIGFFISLLRILLLVFIVMVLGSFMFPGIAGLQILVFALLIFPCIVILLVALLALIVLEKIFSVFLSQEVAKRISGRIIIFLFIAFAFSLFISKSPTLKLFYKLANIGADVLGQNF